MRGVFEGETAHTSPEERQSARRRFRTHRRLTWFDRELRLAHGRLRPGIITFVLQGNLLSLLTAPLVYALVVPMILLDVTVTLFQLVAFPVYGIGRVKRRPYFAVDRHKLAYLNLVEKMNCTYCTYANGLFAYVREVAGRTEQYWCPIRHARAIRDPHRQYEHFVEYGDAEGYHGELARLRRSLAPPKPMH